MAVVDNLTAIVNNSLLEIHFYWAGKGSSDLTQKPSALFEEDQPPPDYNGPLISAISVNPGKKEVGTTKYD